MIIWICSYPKSGNTWVRSIISSLIYSNDGLFNFELLKKIPQYPKKKYFENFTEKFQDIHELKKYWIASQNLINSDKKIRFFKTHHINCKIGEHAFTNRKNTLATIYVVRDPRNLINSFTNHYRLDKNSAKKFISSSQSVTGAIGKMNKQNNIFTILGSWKDHYKSWTKMTGNLLILKYEDLILDPYKEINKIIKFLENFINFKNDNLLLIKYEDLLLDPGKEINNILKFIKSYIKFDYDDIKIRNIINTTSFESMQKMEIDKGFNEAVRNKLNKDKVNFFNLGKDNIWEKYLDEKDVEYLVSQLGVEMKELGYI